MIERCLIQLGNSALEAGSMPLLGMYGSLKINGEDRPTMREVTRELEGLKKSTKHPWADQESHEETEGLLSEASDLYTVQINSGQLRLDSRTIYPINNPQ